MVVGLLIGFCVVFSPNIYDGWMPPWFCAGAPIPKDDVACWVPPNKLVVPPIGAPPPAPPKSEFAIGYY